MTMHVYADADELARAAAEIFTAEAIAAVRERGRFVVALSGGLTPRRMYQELAAWPLRERVPWGQVHVFWGDDRCVPPTDPRSNAGQARRLLLDHVPVPRDQIHPMRCETSPHEAARRYEAELRIFFAGRRARFDLVLLGLGDDGHTASLFPGSPALDEFRRWALDVYVPGHDVRRMTLTTQIINQAALVVFMVSGSAKARTLQAVLEGPRDERRLPAQLIAPNDGRTEWLLDREAAALIRRTERQSL